MEQEASDQKTRMGWDAGVLDSFQSETDRAISKSTMLDVCAVLTHRLLLINTFCLLMVLPLHDVSSYQY